jgi:glycosyltransferase involved in cell wall biosynthesis
MTTPKKIALVGNKNNNFFATARYLSDEGYDVHLFCWPNEVNHFQPEADAYNPEDHSIYSFPKWAQGLASKADSELIKADLEPYDIIMGCYAAPKFMARAGRRLDFFMPHGGDFMLMPFIKNYEPKARIKKAIFRLKTLLNINPIKVDCDLQLQGIRDCRYFWSNYVDSTMEDLIRDDIKYVGERVFCYFPFVYYRIYSNEGIRKYLDSSNYSNRFKQIREENELVIFHHSQHAWKDKNIPNIWSTKNNHILIEGFAAFVKRNPGIKAKFVTIEYGVDVAASKKLIADLGIEDNVIWLPKMYRKDIMIGLHYSDIGAAPFNGFICNGNICEILISGKPMLHNGIDSNSHDYENLRKIFPEFYPIMKAKTPGEVTNQLQQYMSNKEPYEKMGEAGLQWFKKYVVDIPMKQMIEKIESL